MITTGHVACVVGKTLFIITTLTVVQFYYDHKIEIHKLDVVSEKIFKFRMEKFSRWQQIPLFVYLI